MMSLVLRGEQWQCYHVQEQNKSISLSVCVCVCVCVCPCVCVCANCPTNGVIQSTLSECHRQLWEVLWNCVRFRLRLVPEVSTPYLSSSSCLYPNPPPGPVTLAVHSAFPSACGTLLSTYHYPCSRPRPALTPVASQPVL